MSKSPFALAPVVKNVYALTDEAVARLSGLTDEDMIAYTRTSFTAYVEWAVEANTIAPDCPWRTAWTLFELAVLRSSRTVKAREKIVDQKAKTNVVEDGKVQSHSGWRSQ